MGCFRKRPQKVDGHILQRVRRRKELQVAGLIPFLDTVPCASFAIPNCVGNIGGHLLPEEPLAHRSEHPGYARMSHTTWKVLQMEDAGLEC